MLCIYATDTAIELLQLSGMFVAAYPVEKVMNIARDDAPAMVLGENVDHRTSVVVLCVCYAFLLALAQGLSSPSPLELDVGSLTQHAGYRADRMAGQKTSARFSDTLVYAHGFISTAFVFAGGITNAGLSLSTDKQCFMPFEYALPNGAANIAL